MKKILCLLSLFATLSAQAQFTRLTRHPDIPVQYDAAFVDLVKGYYSGTVKSSYGQYFGHLSPDQNVYGYGTFFTDQDGEICGQFRNGDLIVGIRMGTAIVRVGTEDHYTAYDLLTGEPQYVFLNDEKYKLDAEHLASWRYVQLAYKNGDKYVGETVDGKRDGYGIYYYANGNFYFGRYKDNKAVGYGALFKTDNHVSIQYWDGPSEAEQDAAAQAELEAAAAAAEAAQKPEKKSSKRRNVNAWSR